MPVTVIVGAQFGSEGKGKLVAYLARSDGSDFAVRCGGSNAGHSFTYKGKLYLLRHIPCGITNPATRLLIAPGAFVNPEVLVHEIEETGVTPDRLGIDRFTAIISNEHLVRERRLGLDAQISSTLSGTGAATSMKVLRNWQLRFAKDLPILEPFLTDVSSELNIAYDEGKKILIEGTQGFGLSLHHSRYYPYCTSRDTTAAAFLSEVGLSPRCVDGIFMVVRTFPIRVPGSSGPLQQETTWEEITTSSGAPDPIVEITSVTRRIRRVGNFEEEFVFRAAQINRPTGIAIHGIDYIDFSDKGKRRFEDLSCAAKDFIAKVEKLTQAPALFIYTGPDTGDIIDRRGDSSSHR